MPETYYLDDSLVRLMLKKKRQTVRRFYKSGTLDAENITSALHSKHVFTRISGDNHRGSCHVWMDCSGSTKDNVNRQLTRQHLISACGMQLAKYLDRFFNTKMGIFKTEAPELFNIPEKFLPEQYAEFIVNNMSNSDEALSTILGIKMDEALRLFSVRDCNDAPLAIFKSVKLLEKSNKTSLIIAICDGDPYATRNSSLIDEFKKFQKDHAIVFSVIYRESTRKVMLKRMENFKKKFGILSVFTSDQEALNTGGGMLINNTLTAVYETLTKKQ